MTHEPFHVPDRHEQDPPTDTSWDAYRRARARYMGTVARLGEVGRLERAWALPTVAERPALDDGAGW